VATDDLNAPLGLKKKQAGFRPPPYTALATAGLLGVFIATFAIWALSNNDPLGGEPMVTVAVDRTADDGAAAQRKPLAATKAESRPTVRNAMPADSDGHPKAPSREQVPDKAENPPQEKVAGRNEQTVTIIDGKSGARQEVKIPSSAEPAIIATDPQLMEMTRNGPIPRIGPDGQRAALAYAKPVTAKPNSPQIAIVITGLGVSASGTADAINKLPGPITFAFAPYGVDLERVAGKARGLGHELLLQVPMEPFDYPENDPGPQTLTTSLSPEQNIERLQWAMSRFQGYVGVSNYMGARFTASEASFLPIIREISKRGLIFVDDGSSPRSLASQIAGGSSLAFAKSNLVLDTVPSAVEIDRALVRLEGMARENGMAVAFAAALPVTIERIAIWARTAENRGFTLAPITAAAARAKSS
jgi:uncharacterized protein